MWPCLHTVFNSQKEGEGHVGHKLPELGFHLVSGVIGGEGEGGT